MNQVEYAIMKFGLLPYKLGEIIKSPVAFNYGSTIKVFRYSGGRNNGSWGVTVKAGMIDYAGNEIMKYPMTIKKRDDINLIEFTKKLDVLFPTNNTAQLQYVLDLKRLAQYEEEIKEIWKPHEKKKKGLKNE